MQPVQPSLIPEQIPAPAPDVIVSLPQVPVEAAIRVLARLIAQAAVAAITGDGDDE